MLAATVDGDFPARAVCERALDEDPRFALDALGSVQVDETRTTVAPAPKETPEERAAKQEQRRQRKQQHGKAQGQGRGSRSPEVSQGAGDARPGE